MEDQYGIADLRQYISGRPLFPPIPQQPPPPPDLLSAHRGFNQPHHPYDMLVFRPDSTASVTTPNTNAGASSSVAAGGCFSGFENGGGGGGGGDGGTGRWPRQETLTLLEIRSRLDSKFKEANQKGPLWDEVSRIMSEEHGYQRSGKKCREKFENLYKYYKKTKEGKAGRQDGKHYRFFRQLEALYGDTSNNNNSTSVSEAHLVGGNNFHYNYPNNNHSLASNQDAFNSAKLSDTSLSLSNYSEAETSSSDDSDDDLNDENDSKNKKRRGRRGWKVKIRDFIDAQMKKLMDKQEAWMDKMMRTIEHKEQERMLREEEWRKQDAARIDREHEFWARERAWIEARDSALMGALQKLTGKELAPPQEEMAAGPEIRSLSENQNEDTSETMTNSAKGDIWPECEISKLIQLRTSMDVKFQQSGVSEDILWEEIANKMACFGHDRTGLMCKEKFVSVNNYLLKCNKKLRKENTSSKSCNYNNYHEPSISNQGGSGVVYCDASEQGISNDHAIMRLNDHGHSSPNANTTTGNAVNDSCFRYFMGDAYGRIMD